MPSAECSWEGERAAESFPAAVSFPMAFSKAGRRRRFHLHPRGGLCLRTSRILAIFAVTSSLPPGTASEREGRKEKPPLAAAAKDMSVGRGGRKLNAIIDAAQPDGGLINDCPPGLSL